MPIRGIVITHSLLAEAFIATVEQIAGKQSELMGLSNSGLSNEALADRLLRLIGDSQATITFIDFNGGSTGAVARQVVEQCRQGPHPTCATITGVNLPMLLSFVTKRDKLEFALLVETLRQDGHRGIQ